MFNNITFGQYFPIDSFVHNMDPRVKIIVSFAMVIIIFLIDTFTGYIPLLAFLIIGVLLSKVSFLQVLKGIRPLLIIIILTFVLNVFFFKGTTIIFEWGFLHVTVEGVRQAVIVALRLIFLIEVTTLMMLTTSPMQITDALESLFGPLKKVNFPVHEVAMMMSIALRFIPTLIEETDKIMKAQTARGAEFDSGNLIKRALSLVPLLVPLFVSAFKRADDLAMAMESRCYNGGKNRTRMKILKTRATDYVAVCVTVVFVVFMLIL